MKSYLQIIALFILLVVSVSFADPMPVPEYAEETVESDGVVTVEAGIEVEPTLLKHYSPLIAGFGNLVPGLGYFLIDEPWWGAAELGLCGAGVTLIISTLRTTSNRITSYGVIGFVLIGFTYFNGIIHAPLLAEYKNDQQKVALDLSPGLGLDSEGVVYPTVQLTLSF